MAIAPHFRYPFRFSGTSVAVLEQDTFDEVAQSVQVILQTPKGARIEVPTFGIDDPVFSINSPARETRMYDAIKEFEPRANATLSITPDNVEETLQHIRVNIPYRPNDDQLDALPQA